MTALPTRELVDRNFLAFDDNEAEDVITAPNFTSCFVYSPGTLWRTTWPPALAVD